MPQIEDHSPIMGVGKPIESILRLHVVIKCLSAIRHLMECFCAKMKDIGKIKACKEVGGHYKHTLYFMQVFVS